ncbi:basic-leucine zipper transcription factor nucleus DNA binding regulation of transcription, DNA-dependent [Cryphonectria parasitica EP155]|uniref:Putative transcription factor kapC n=1 Tax=Cryphonectria parasitica (strain ATCC 38755 / EP155) TaxID=660469 RepID=A0A9P4XT82_CRYP1|nr:basic-leucine zipper transcription factor nucleus DNA binding regulation of transcription, DNA-dependent [Cryphonectria parasitica EP155]KAF3760478.1 basic-leucine zipper transcription factor nucleus DNA binding regulation of transcription, DNA-dependent [Cryphonectria parasitica EP155]
MEGPTIYLDVSSPSSCYQYLYGDHEQYLDGSHSESHSSATSPYDMTCLEDGTGTSAFHSPDSRDADDGCESQQEGTAVTTTQSKPATKRKRENRYKNAPPSVLSRRRAQNRASQRAYRERKDQRIKDLEQMLNDARARNDVLSQAYAQLQAEYVKLKSNPSHPHLDVHHSHSHSHAAHPLQIASSIPASSYQTIPGTSMPANFVDPTSMAVLNASSDLDAYLYPDVGAGSYGL